MPCRETKECPVGSLPYIVRDGDTLYKIALSYNTTSDAIIASNVNLNPYNLNIGQVICIPLPNESYPACRTTNYYIAQEGDTFFSIGQKFGVDVQEIINANMGILPENIFTGIILCIPVAPSPVCMYTTVSGDTLTILNKKTDSEKTYKSRLRENSVLVPGRIVLTKKRLESGSVDGAKELLFSPFEFGIRGKAQMRDSNGLFLELSDSDMLEVFNSVTVGTILEVRSK